MLSRVTEDLAAAKVVSVRTSCSSSGSSNGSWEETAGLEGADDRLARRSAFYSHVRFTRINLIFTAADGKIKIQ